LALSYAVGDRLVLGESQFKLAMLLDRLSYPSDGSMLLSDLPNACDEAYSRDAVGGSATLPPAKGQLISPNGTTSVRLLPLITLHHSCISKSSKTAEFDAVTL
jgi:hypothetical protein